MKKWNLIAIAVVLVFIVCSFIFIRYYTSNGKIEINQSNNSNEISCNNDLDCVASSCCHPNSCVNKDFAPKCAGSICSQVCAPGSLDCGQGSCLCVNKKCNAVMK